MPKIARKSSIALGSCAVVALAVAIAAPAGAVQAPISDGPKVLDAPSSLIGLSPVLPQSVIDASTSPHSKWKPGPAKYGTAVRNNVAVRGAGGTTIRVNVTYPTAHGKLAKGPFPVVLTMTPYGKGKGASARYLVQRGYINIVEDVRGTGNSHGSFGLFDPIQQRDAIKVVNWAAHLPQSNGRVGTYGPSYLGIDQALLAGAVGKHSPLKAIFPMVTANDSYRDTSFMGGLLDAEFSGIYVALTGSLNTANPVVDAVTDRQVLGDLLKVELDHGSGLTNFDAPFTVATLTGGGQAYDGTYWKNRAPQQILKRIVANRIPAFLVGGEFDIFQHGEPINYAELQNAWAGRSVTAPMLPNQKVTGRYQLIDGPWEHLNGSAVDVNYLELEWFDTWLKHKHTGMAHTPTPLHYYDLGTGRFVETTSYPFNSSKATQLFFGSGNTLASSVPASGSTSIAWLPSGSPCGRPIDQWGIGVGSIPVHMAGLLAPCADDDTLSKLGPGQVSFTTAPLTAPRTIAGPITATVYASATTTDTEWVATIDDVTPSGRSYPLTEGALLGSLRAVNRARSWSADGLTVLPYHPYTRASAKPVVPGKVTKYEIEIFPTLATIAKGDRLRVTLSTADVPHLTPILTDLPNLLGGVYSIKYGGATPSSLTVEFRKP